ATGPVQWGDLLARVLGAPLGPRGFLLESLFARGVRPSTAALVRTALGGDPRALEEAAALVPGADAEVAAARALRLRAESGLEGALGRALAPELRRDEAYAVYAWGRELAPVAVSTPPSLDKLAISPGASPRLAVRARGAGRVTIVRAEPGKAVLLPSDGVAV